MNRQRMVFLGISVFGVLLASCGGGPSRVATGDTASPSGQPFRVFDTRGWISPIIVGSKAVMVGRTADDVGLTAQVRIVDLSGDTIEPTLEGMSRGAVSAVGKDDSNLSILFTPCETIGPSGNSTADTKCTEWGSSRLVDYNLDDRTTTEVPVPDGLRRLFDASHRVDLETYTNGTLFLTLQDGDLLTEVHWDMKSDAFLSSPVDGGSSADMVSTCVTDDGVRYDTVTTNGVYAGLSDGLEAGPTRVERRASTGKRTVNELPEPPTVTSRWETACVDDSAFVVAGGANSIPAAEELDAEALGTSEPLVTSAQDPEPQPPAKILQLPDLSGVPEAPAGKLSTETGGGGVFTDGETTELINKDGSLTEIPWVPPGIASTSQDVLVSIVTTESTPDTSVIIDLDEYDETAAKALKEELYG